MTSAVSSSTPCESCAKNWRFVYSCCHVKRCERCSCPTAVADVCIEAAAAAHHCFESGSVGVCENEICQSKFNYVMYRLSTCCDKLICSTCIEPWYAAHSSERKCKFCNVVANNCLDGNVKAYRIVEYIKEKTKQCTVKAAVRQKGHLDTVFLEEVMRAGFSGPNLLNMLREAAPRRLLFDDPLPVVPAHLLSPVIYKLQDLKNIFADKNRPTCANPHCLGTLSAGWKSSYGTLPSLGVGVDDIKRCLLCTLFEAEYSVHKWLVEGSSHIEPPRASNVDFVFNVMLAADVGATCIQIDNRDVYLVAFRGHVGMVKPSHYYPYRQFLKRLSWDNDGQVCFE